MVEKALSELVRTGELNSQALKAEFRRRSLLVHPDTSGLPGAAFVTLQQDFAAAEAWLKARPKPASRARYDFRRFCEFLRQARAKGLPSKALAHHPSHRSLVRKTVAMAALVSADLAASVEAYLTGSAAPSPAFDQALVNLLDAVQFHQTIPPRTAARIQSYLDEVPPGDMTALVHWIRNALDKRIDG